MTYIRARPGTQTPPVAKVPRHTQLMVWGKFDGWYRVETTDHKFGWVHNELLHSPALDNVKEMSHSKARRASDSTSNQLMYGSVEDLKKHYQRFGAPGAKKGLAMLGVKVKSKPGQSSSQRLAAQKAAQQKAVQAKIAQQKAAQAKANQARWAAAKAAQEKAAQQKTAQQKAALAKAEQYKAAQARLAAQKAAAAKMAQAKAASARAEQARLAQEKAAQAKFAAKTASVQPTPSTAVAKAVPSTKALSGTPLQPILPNPTTAVAVKSVAPAIPIPPKTAAKTARKGNYQAPNITAEDLMKAREEHLKRSSSASSAEQAPKPSNKTAFLPQEFIPQVYYLASAVYSPAMAKGDSAAHFIPTSFTRDSLPSAQFTPHEEYGPKPLVVPLDRTVPSSSPAKKTIIAKNTAKAPAKPSLSAKAAPNRGGSPRDYARLAQNNFGQGIANQALSYRGRPYIRGAASPSHGFDCSGLVYYLLRQRGYNPPRTAAGLAHYGKAVPMGQLQPGDLVLFANTYKRGVSHVGIYMGNNNFVHAATSGTGVRVSSLNEAYYRGKYWGARRVEVKK
jgi:cell wall-associated NlpC family hydrolase